MSAPDSQIVLIPGLIFGIPGLTFFNPDSQDYSQDGTDCNPYQCMEVTGSDDTFRCFSPSAFSSNIVYNMADCFDV